jgi:hypothetical protein
VEGMTRIELASSVWSLIKLPSGKVGVWVLTIGSLWSRVTPWCFGYLPKTAPVQKVVA